MKTVKLLEELANKTHYSQDLRDLINKQPESIKKALESKDSNLLRKQFSTKIRLANMTQVVQY